MSRDFLGTILQQVMGGIGHVSVEQSWVHVGAVVRPDMLFFSDLIPSGLHQGLIPKNK